MLVSVLVALQSMLTVPAGELVDRVVAAVDGQVVTQSELLGEARVALVARHGDAAASVAIDDETSRAFLSYVVNQMLISSQARRLGTAEVNDAAVTQELQRFVAQFPTSGAYQVFLHRCDISEEVLRHLFERNLRNERFISERMRLLVGAGVTDPASVEYQQTLRRWLDELRDASDVRILGPSGELESYERQVAKDPRQSDAIRRGDAR